MERFISIRYLVPVLNVYENIAFPILLEKEAVKEVAQ